MKTYRALAAILSYPEQELLDALPELRRAIEGEGIAALPELEGLFADGLLAAQERYVALFDRSKALSLHLFEHVHGDSRDRGQAMVDLAGVYAERGVEPAQGELPDYLPAFLEFLSLLPPEEARAMLADAADILRALGERLAARASPYAAVFEALLAVAGEPGLKKVARVAPPAEQPDRDWMEPPVTFGGPQPVRLYRHGVPA
ncbi:MAG TPA: nitrate reductase molybdenum cofactor assembly chaperone [Burkholderiales bacterium]|nr:nitrate reductase molybdenum cofactor assembly chaperone [Burkholderiales bacterium]